MPDPIQGVNRIDPVEIAPTTEPGSSPAAVAPPPASAAAAAVDTADLTRAQGLLSLISQAAAAVPTVDRGLVAQLQQALNSGTYTANPGLIAEKIMEIESLLSSRGSIG